MKRALFLLLCLGLAAGFAGLGVWQAQRLAWKQALIERVDARLAASPVPPPSAAAAQVMYELARRSGEKRRERREGRGARED